MGFARSPRPVSISRRGRPGSRHSPRGPFHLGARGLPRRTPGRVRSAIPIGACFKASGRVGRPDRPDDPGPRANRGHRVHPPRDSRPAWSIALGHTAADGATIRSRHRGRCAAEHAPGQRHCFDASPASEPDLAPGGLARCSSASLYRRRPSPRSGDSSRAGAGERTGAYHSGQRRQSARRAAAGRLRGVGRRSRRARSSWRARPIWRARTRGSKSVCEICF